MRQELMRDLPALYNDRLPFFDHLLACVCCLCGGEAWSGYKRWELVRMNVCNFATNSFEQLLKSHLEYYTSVSREFSGSAALVRDIDEKTTLTHPKVITPTERSYYTKNVRADPAFRGGMCTCVCYLCMGACTRVCTCVCACIHLSTYNASLRLTKYYFCSTPTSTTAKHLG